MSEINVTNYLHRWQTNNLWAVFGIRGRQLSSSSRLCLQLWTGNQWGGWGGARIAEMSKASSNLLNDMNLVHLEWLWGFLLNFYYLNYHIVSCLNMNPYYENKFRNNIKIRFLLGMTCTKNVEVECWKNRREQAMINSCLYHKHSYLKKNIKLLI